jgi:hypothetical protein
VDNACEYDEQPMTNSQASVEKKVLPVFYTALRTFLHTQPAAAIRLNVSIFLSSPRFAQA